MKSLHLPVLIMALCINVSCRDTRHQSCRIGSVEYRIPKRFIIEGTPFWLPFGSDRYPIITLNPDSALPDQITVLLEPVNESCRGIRTFSSKDWSHLCKSPESFKRLDNEDIENMRKLSDKYNLTWRYFLNADHGSHQQLVAACHRMENSPKNGLCTHRFRVGSVALRVGLDENQLPALPAIQRNLEAALKVWAID